MSGSTRQIMQKGGRSWNTPIREPWNPIIKHCLNAIDLHVKLYLEAGDETHMEQAALLREYVKGLKDWVTSAEKTESFSQEKQS